MTKQFKKVNITFRFFHWFFEAPPADLYRHGAQCAYELCFCAAFHSLVPQAGADAGTSFWSKQHHTAHWCFLDYLNDLLIKQEPYRVAHKE